MQQITDLNDGWEFIQKDWLGEPPTYIHYPDWLPATVPGHVHLDLIANGIIRDPFEEMAELGCQWVDEADWCYRKRFNWSAGDPETLVFEGLDTICTVYLNGEEIARRDNMFLPLEVHLGGKLKAGENELRVDFESAARVGRERRRAYFGKNGISPDVKNFDERAFVRKAQYMFGWDWGPRLVSCGIWKPVKLISGLDLQVRESPNPARVHLRREPDKFGESFEFIVDGKPLWAMGANWIPIHSFPSHTARLCERLEDCAAMNFNMLRVWGGGLYESDEFYDLCDKLDILVWQDFPFACSYYPDDDDFVERIREEATYHVRRLRHHRCLALWCGNNENLTMWQGKWGGVDRNPTRFYGERIWNEVLKEVVEEHDPGRPYIPTSPIGSPPGVEDCNAGGYGDSHYWDVWHGRGDWVHYADSTARFSSEFGFPSSCGRKAWGHVISRPVPPPSKTHSLRSGQAPSAHFEGWGPDHPSVRWHDKTGRPWEYWRELITKHYPEPKDLDELIYYSQLNQRDAMRFAIEHYRRSEFCKGTLIWQVNDCWPVQSWSLIDSEGEWKAAAYEVERLYSPWLTSYERIGNVVKVWRINDFVESSNLSTSNVGAYDSLTGEPLRIWPLDSEIELRPGERRVLIELDISDLDPTRVILWPSMGGDAPWGLLCEPKDLQLRQPRIRARIDHPGILEVLPDVPVVDLFLWDPSGKARFRRRSFDPPNFRTFETQEPWWYGFEGDLKRVMGRSLAGVHEIELTDEPIWPRKG